MKLLTYLPTSSPKPQLAIVLFSHCTVLYPFSPDINDNEQAVRTTVVQDPDDQMKIECFLCLFAYFYLKTIDTFLSVQESSRSRAIGHVHRTLCIRGSVLLLLLRLAILLFFKT